jgi:predicted metalloprotease with PDZ domain
MFRKSMLASAAILLAVAGFVFADAQRAYLGIMGDDPPPESNEAGAVVKDVVKDGPADKAGLKPGDRIVAVDDQEVKSFDDLQVRLGGFKPGQVVRMKVVRDASEETLSVELGARPPDPPAPKRNPAKIFPDAERGRADRFPFRFRLGEGLPEEVQKQIEEAMKNAFGDAGRPAAPKPMIGVQLQPIDEALAKKLGLDEPKGALIVAVVPDGPAAKAGLESEDVVVEADGKPVDSPEALKEIVASKGENDALALKVRRGDETLEKSVTVAMGPAGPPAGFFFREFTSPEDWGGRFDDLRKQMDQWRERAEKAASDRFEQLQKKLDEGHTALEAAKERIAKLEQRLEEFAKQINELRGKAAE